MGLLSRGRPKKKSNDPEEESEETSPRKLPPKFKEMYDDEEDLPEYYHEEEEAEDPKLEDRSRRQLPALPPLPKKKQNKWVLVTKPIQFEYAIQNQQTGEEIVINDLQDAVDIMNKIDN